MEIKLSDRTKEAMDKMRELNEELTDYANIVNCIHALKTVTENPHKYNYERKDYELVVERIRKLCNKHEIVIPDVDTIEWGSVEIL